MEIWRDLGIWFLETIGEMIPYVFFLFLLGWLILLLLRGTISLAKKTGKLFTRIKSPPPPPDPVAPVIRAERLTQSQIDEYKMEDDLDLIVCKKVIFWLFVLMFFLIVGWIILQLVELSKL